MFIDSWQPAVHKSQQKTYLFRLNYETEYLAGEEKKIKL